MSLPPARKVLCVVGTRPEVIKMAPVIARLREETWADVRVMATAQHRDLLDQSLAAFGLTADVDLDLMRPGQTLPDLTARCLLALDAAFETERPDAVLAQGDTTTVMTTALACFYRSIPFGHVEAGLRTGQLAAPFPEEMNRIVADRLAHWHFAPTEKARMDLAKEGVPAERTFVTGNTGIDALLSVASRTVEVGVRLDPERRLILVTVHRRESHGEALASIARALTTIARRNPDVQLLCPVHPNPRVADEMHRLIGNREGVVLCPPLAYVGFVAALLRSHLVLTDSGGIQEEAPALGIPVLVLRDVTERPEAVSEGVVRVVGTRTETIVDEVQRLLDDQTHHASMARKVFPYGDGHASDRIASILRRELAGGA